MTPFVPGKTDTAVVCGNHINAHTLVRSLAKLGWPGRVVLLRHDSEPAGLAACLNPRTEQWAVALKSAEELPPLIEARYGRDGQVVVLFTDERFHLAFAAWEAAHPASALRFHLGCPRHMAAILDRYEFCRFIASRGLASVPRTIRGDEDPFAAFGDAFIVRPRLSWFGVAQRERVKLVRSRAAYEAALASFASRGLRPTDLNYQELLSTRNQDNVSISGWYGPTVRQLYCTRKVLQYPPETGGGDVVERLTPPAGVMQQAERILAALAYEGPFELEFVYDTKAREFRATELNPRFWLQHGLIEAVSGCALTSAYLGWEPRPATPSEQRLRYWVNPLYTVYRTLKADLRSLRYCCTGRCWMPLTLREVARYGLHYAQETLRRGRD